MPLIIDAKIQPSGSFAAADAKDIEYKEGRLTDYLPVYLTQEEYDVLVENGDMNPHTPYMIVRDDL